MKTMGLMTVLTVSCIMLWRFLSLASGHRDNILGELYKLCSTLRRGKHRYIVYCVVMVGVVVVGVVVD